MSNLNEYAPKSWWPLLKLNFVIATIITLMTNFSAIMALNYQKVLPNFIYSYLISLTLSYGITTIIEVTNKRISWIENPIKRFLIEMISVSIYALIVGSLFDVISLLIFSDHYSLNNLPWTRIFRNSLYPIAISLFVTLILTSRAFLLEWRKSAIASEKLRADRYQGQYQSLKNQLNPHFFFNSFNTLSNLVYDDQEKAVNFIQKLSKIYRYVLEVQKEELISVAEELSFLENYIDLQKVRFGENLKVNIGSLDQEMFLPPLSLQLLIENAIKHNIISKNDPLEVSLFQKNDYLIVKNNMQLKNIKETSTGIGIKNINERLKFFTDKELIIHSTDDMFEVQLPLLKNILK